MEVVVICMPFLAMSKWMEVVVEEEEGGRKEREYSGSLFIDPVYPFSSPQVFQRVICREARSQGDAKFDYFKRHVLSEILRRRQSHVLIFIPSYYDFIRVRNYMIKEDISHACVSEYERGTETARSRSRFFHGHRDILLYTGRAHFFRRYMIRGATHLILYGPPECPHFYPELVNLLEEADNTTHATSCLALFTRFEALALERIVGSERSRHMVTSEKGTFLFC